MKLFYSPTSPYARKVRIVAAEKGLDDRIELVPCNPFEDADELRRVNPLGKVPCLMLDDGTALYDSPVICEYLDAATPTPRLLPADERRWRVLRLQALADGMLDAAVAIVMERWRPEGERSEGWIRRWSDAIRRGADTFAEEIATLPETISLAHVAMGAALGYLDFRLPELEWRADRKSLATWYETFAERSSMRATRPAS